MPRISSLATCQALGVVPEVLWDKVGAPLHQIDLVERLEHTALRIVQGGILTHEETAFLVLAGVEHLFACTKTPLKPFRRA